MTNLRLFISKTKFWIQVHIEVVKLESENAWIFHLVDCRKVEQPSMKN